MTKKYYIVGFFDYIFAMAAFWDGLALGIRLIAGVCAIIATIYLIRKYHTESELNRERLKREKMETEIKAQELANLILKNKNL